MIKGTPANETVKAVLDLLATNHDFREQMLGDPVSALKSHGIEVDPDKVPAVRRLPSMAEVAKVRQQVEGVPNPLDRLGLIAFLLK
jgi:putative modified peptide